jgi:serine protease
MQRSTLAALGGALSILFTTTVDAGGPGPQRAAPIDYADRIIVRYRDGTVRSQNTDARVAAALTQRFAAQTGVPMRHHRHTGGGDHVIHLGGFYSGAWAREIARRVAQDPDVLDAEADLWMHPLQVAPAPNDPRYAEQWDLSSATVGINAQAAWSITKGAPNIVMAVLDTGIRPHSEFGNRVLPGYDFVSATTAGNDGGGRDADASDPGDWCPPDSPRSSWHGTHVAGTMGATGDNGVGIAGINWRSKILPVRVLGKCGGATSDIADGMRWAAGLAVPGVPLNVNPAKVMNLSLGGSGACGTTMRNAINAVVAKGAVIVVAAGNSNVNASNATPANCAGVIAVAASNRVGGKSNYSNFGTTVKITAPGGQTSTGTANGILSTLNAGATTPGADSYAFYQGTSMAAPHVAGVVSLMYSVNSTLTPARVLQILQSTARRFPTGTGSDCTTTRCGAGLLDAGAAVAAARPVTPALMPAEVEPAVEAAVE